MTLATVRAPTATSTLPTGGRGRRRRAARAEEAGTFATTAIALSSRQGERRARPPPVPIELAVSADGATSDVARGAPRHARRDQQPRRGPHAGSPRPTPTSATPIPSQLRPSGRVVRARLVSTRPRSPLERPETALSSWAVALACATGRRRLRAASRPALHARAAHYNPGDYAQEDRLGPADGSLFDATPRVPRGHARGPRRRLRHHQHQRERQRRRATPTNLSKDTSAHHRASPSARPRPGRSSAAYPDIDPTQLIAFASKTGFVGAASTTREGAAARGSIAVRVSNEMPNGDLFIEGTKVVLINNEEYHLYLSGLVRPADIARTTRSRRRASPTRRSSSPAAATSPTQHRRAGSPASSTRSTRSEEPSP